MAHPLLAHVPYCGFPPSPANLSRHWNLDPVLLLALAAIAMLYAAGAVLLSSGSRPIKRRELMLFYSGWLIGSAALVSPLCPLSVSLFAARVGQHMILTLAAAPLVAAGRPAAAFSALLFRSSTDGTSDPLARAPLAAAALFAGAMWFWHAPVPYAETFANTGVYWAMHISLFGSALWLWEYLLGRAPAMLIKSLRASVISSVQMGFLGAIITFAGRPLYMPHLFTTAAWGLTPLQDQQLGGVIMWVPGCAIFLLVSVSGLWLLLERTQWTYVSSPASVTAAEPQTQIR
jgi:putative membrane protein